VPGQIDEAPLGDDDIELNLDAYKKEYEEI
jgi:hypothetical protein